MNHPKGTTAAAAAFTTVSATNRAVKQECPAAAETHLHHNQRMPLVQPPIGTTATTMISNDMNLMPSMVVKQQKSHLSSTLVGSGANYVQNNNNNNKDDLLTTQELLIKTRSALAANENGASSDTRNNNNNSQLFDQNGLILPRRVPKQHQQLLASGLAAGQQSSATLTTTIQDLNRELKFNQVTGKDVLDQKSELKKAMEKLAANRRRKEAEQERLSRRTSLELRLEERAQRIARESTTSGANGGAGAGATASQSNEAKSGGVLS